VNGIISGTVPTGPDNGYNGDFAGYTILSAANGGPRPYVQGWELTYQQTVHLPAGAAEGVSRYSAKLHLDRHAWRFRRHVVPHRRASGRVHSPHGEMSASRGRYRRFNTRARVELYQRLYPRLHGGDGGS